MSSQTENKSSASKAWTGLIIFVVVGGVVLLSNRGGEIKTPEGLPVIADSDAYNDAKTKSHLLSAPALQAYIDGQALSADQTDQIRKAVVLFDAMDSYRPTEFTTYFLCGTAYAALGEYEKANERFQQGILNAQGKTEAGVAAAVADAHHERSICLTKLNQTKEAFEEADTAVRLAPISAVYLANRAKCALDLGNKTQALADVKSALKLDPNNTQAKMLEPFTK